MKNRKGVDEVAKGKEFKTDIIIGGKVSPTLAKAISKANAQSNALKKIGNAGKAIGKATLAASAAAAAGVVAITASAVKSYAEYEQLVGGVDTLFKESSKTVQQYANNAYKTAGLSANEYMSTITSFSASLLQSLGGDTVKAAEYGNRAVIDMADNANKMGTSIDMIQNAYQGFAKQNYTMLDNLKLGYGGTKTEMQRLLADASKISGIKYDISSFADITQAIHIIQTEMGITGTTANEAASTIQGSFGMLKASWQNLLTGMADENADFDSLLTNFIDSIGTVAQNLLPRISVVIGGIFKLVEGLMPQIPALIQQLLPLVVSGAVSLLQGVASAFPQIVQTIVEVLPQLINSVVSALPQLLPALITGIVSVFSILASSFSDIIQPIIDNLPTIILSIVEALMNNLPAIIQGLIQLIIGIVQALPQIMAAFYQATPVIWQMILEGLIQSLPILLSGLVSIVKTCWDALVSMFTTVGTAIGNAIGGAIKAVVNTVIKFAEGLINGFINTLNSAIKLINKIPGVNIPLIKTLNIPRLATGGSFDGRHPQLAVVGDAAETMVPHGNTPRNRALLAEAARGVGVGLGNNINITFSPVIYGGSGADVRQAIIDSEAEFERKMDAYFARKGRVSFA